MLHTLLTGVDSPGYASIMVAVLMLGGLNLMSLGIIGEYLGRVAQEVRNRPLYVVAEESEPTALPDIQPHCEEQDEWIDQPMRA